jgi:hypothetical protein
MNQLRLALNWRSDVRECGRDLEKIQSRDECASAAIIFFLWVDSILEHYKQKFHALLKITYIESALYVELKVLGCRKHR